MHVRRAKKTYPGTSMELNANLGGAILDAFPEMKVDVHDPQLLITVEIREKIYIYSDLEDGAFTAQPLFRINGEYYTEGGIAKAVKKGKMPSSLSKQEKSDIRWTIMAYAVAVRWLCRDYGRDIPTVIKLIYDAKTRQVRAQYGYERLKSLSEYDDNARCRMWFDEIRAKNL